MDYDAENPAGYSDDSSRHRAGCLRPALPDDGPKDRHQTGPPGQLVHRLAFLTARMAEPECETEHHGQDEHGGEQRPPDARVERLQQRPQHGRRQRGRVLGAVPDEELILQRLYRRGVYEVDDGGAVPSEVEPGQGDVGPPIDQLPHHPGPGAVTVQTSEGAAE